MKDINLLSLDLELNQPSGTIIQVGAVVGNLASGVILEECNSYVYTDEIISDFIVQLTGVTQEKVYSGKPIQYVYNELSELHKKHSCFRNPITWGGGDTECLKQSVKLDDKMFLFGRRWIDVKTLFITWQWLNNQPHQAGLSKALTKLGLEFQGRKHSAVDDARNTFIIYRELMNKFQKGI